MFYCLGLWWIKVRRFFVIIHILRAFFLGMSLRNLMTVRGPIKMDGSGHIIAESSARIYGLKVTGGGTLVIGENVEIRNLYVHLGKGAVVTLSRGVFIGEDVKIISYGSVFIGENTIVAPNVVILDNDHLINDCPIKSTGLVISDTTIGNDCWIGANSVIGKGVVMGNGCVLGCMSFLNVITGENELFVGSPARKIRDIR